jgi:hypothetical protein
MKPADLDLDEINRYLGEVVRCFERVYICIDALDERGKDQRTHIVHMIATLLCNFKSSVRIL